MSKEHAFDNPADFVARLEELLKSGVAPERLETITPFHVHETDHLLHVKPSPLKFFTLIGAVTGLVAGLGLTLYSVQDWPLITGGKPVVSMPAFVVITFELTILIGALCSFAGFLILGRLPSLRRILQPREHENRFIIIEHDGEGA